MLAQIGRYEIKSELGRGGMATVYLGYDPRFRREVAIKVLPREFLHDPTFRVRFEREAQTIAALEHPAIVPVYDYGEEAGQPYLVMRYLPGGTLSTRLEQSRVSPAESIRILNCLAPALDEAHRQGIIHRDLKPDNILFDQHETPYITDFGIAKLSREGVTITTGQVIIGTPAYMSPEQARGESVIDGRSDLYALGIIVFQMLTGQLPFKANTPIGLVLKHITEPVPNILELQPELPPGCNTVMVRALAKEPDQRYSTATALAAALAQTIALKSTSQPVGEPPLQPTPLPAGRELVCPSCRLSNPVEKRYCIGCGVQLLIDCPRCYTANPIGEIFCLNCGANLGHVRTKREELAEQRQRSQQERQQALVAKEARQRQEKLHRLIQSLKEPGQHEFAIYQLDQFAGDAVKPLIEALSTPDNPHMRSGAARALGQICLKHELTPLLKARAAKALINALADPEPNVRYWAAGALGNFKGQSAQLAVEPLAELLKDRHQEVRQQARLALQNIGGTHAQEILDKSKGLKGWLKRS